MMIRTSLGLAVIAAVVAACSDTADPPVATTLQVNPQNVSVETWDTVRVTATVLDQRDRPYEGAVGSISWSTSAAGVATVQGGLIRGDQPGQATITAQALNLTPAQAQVAVEARTVSAQLSFDFSGHRAGSFAMSGSYALHQIDWSGDWGLTFFHAAFSAQDLEAQRRRPDGKVDYLLLWIDGGVGASGSYTAQAQLTHGMNLSTFEFESLYFGTGPLTLTTVSPRRLAGTFELEMLEVAEVGPGDFAPTGEQLDITSGVFDLPVVALPPDVADITTQAMAASVAAPAASRGLRLPRR
jgi:hypothetical protein